MRYFELLDDVTVPNRWHLGEVTLVDGTEPRLRAGIRFEQADSLTVPVTQPGRVLEFSLTSFAVPVATRQLAEVVAAIAGPDLQCVPVAVAGQQGIVVLNSVRVIGCLDQTRSEYIKWTKQDHRADLAGQFRQVTRLVIDPSGVPSDAHFFRVKGWLVALIVSQAVKDAMERTGCLGAKFLDVTPSI